MSTQDPRALVRQAFAESAAEQTPRETKSNTWVVIIGGVLTLAVAGITYALDQLLIPTELTTYATSAVAVIGYLLTVLKVSRTPNSVTPSNERKVLNKVDEILASLPAGVQDGLEQARDEAASRAEQWLREHTGLEVDLVPNEAAGLVDEQSFEYVGDHRVGE